MSSIQDKIRQIFADEYHLSFQEEIIESDNSIPNNEVLLNQSPLINNDILNQEIEKVEQMQQKNSLSPINNPELLELYNECSSCSLCELCHSATNLVFGYGDSSANLMVIGEAPGADEDAQGIPFVGRAGQLLTKILAKYNMPRENIYIANILKHRPPNNRNPLPSEIEACTPFLRKQIAIVKPRLIITLGNFASQFILSTKTGITKIRGSIQDSAFGTVMPTLHPSAIIRGAYPVELFENDIVKALEYIGHPISENGDL